MANANFVDWHTQSTSFREIAAFHPFNNFNLTGDAEPARLSEAAVSSNFFRLLGVRMELGRDFLAAQQDCFWHWRQSNS